MNPNYWDSTFISNEKWLDEWRPTLHYSVKTFDNYKQRIYIREKTNENPTSDDEREAEEEMNDWV